MRPYDELVAEAVEAEVDGWGFGWLDGRATEERPPWGYARLMAAHLAAVDSALDIDTGGGEVLAEASVLPGRMCATESWPPNAARARARLEPRGVEIAGTQQGAPLPFADASFELVTSRHPVRPDWAEIARVLAPGGTYLAQHVGPHSAFELIEWFLGPVPGPPARDPEVEAADATAVGLEVVDLRTARLRMELCDIGSVVWILRKCVWWVLDFTVERYDRRLRELDALIRREGRFVAHSTRHLIEARRVSG